MENIDSRDKLRNVVNHVAAELLQSGPDTFGNDLTRCMGMMAETVAADRVYIWKNHTINGKLYCTQLYEWSGGATPQQDSDLTTNVSYDDIAPEWEEMLSKGDCICGFVRDMAPAIRAQLAAQKILSVFVMPLFVHSQFWGFVGFDDCHTERLFTESEKSILESGCILLANALLRNAQDLEVREAHDRVRVVLDKTPFACHMWNRNFEMIDCNEENIRLFRVADKKELMDHWADFSPEYQPDGQLSVDVARRSNQKAFDEGKCVLKEFIHMASDGTLLPTEITIVRIPYDDDFVIAVYLRDLREQKRMVDAIKHRDNLLGASNSSATALLSASNDEKFEDSILESMGYIGRYINVDRIYFWRNVTIDGDLCYKLMCEWLNDTGYQGTPVDSNAVFSYAKYNPEWQEKFLRNECVNGPLRELSDSDKRVLSMYGMKSILVIPFFLQDVFWGFVSFEDCRDERRFSNDEIEILRSVGLMMASAFERSAQAADIREAHERTALMLNATPLACRLMRRGSSGKFELFECNEESVKLFGFRDKQEFIDRYFEIYPEFQPDGKNSIEEGQKHFDEAYEGGSCVANFTFQMPDGKPVPAEITLIRVKYGDEDVVAGYTRDLREQERMLGDIKRRDNLLNVINRVAALLLSPAMDEQSFEKSLLEGMELIGKCLEADAVQIWPNEIINDTLHFTLKYKWLSEDGFKAPPVAIGTALPYNARWKELFLRGECVNGPVAELPPDEHELWASVGITSTVTIPLFYQDKFWGIFCADDCVKERYYTEGEIDILRSAGLMLVNAMNRSAQDADIREAHERAELLLDAMPYSGCLINKNMKLFRCNEGTVRLFRLKDRQEFIDHFYDLSPEYQPDGRLSAEAAVGNIKKAFAEGKCVFEWMHKRKDGTPLPAETTLVRIAYGGEYAVAGYIRDLSEHKQMMNEIDRKTRLLDTVNQAANILLGSESDNFQDDFQLCMSMIGRAVGADRVCIWKNKTIGEKLYCDLIYDWPGGTGSLINSDVAVNVSYEKNTPGWEEILSQGKCINASVSKLTQEEQSQLKAHGVKSLFVAPVFIRNEFWGYVGFDDFHNEKIFSVDEASILYSSSLLIANALVRNEMILNIQSANDAKSSFLANMSHEMRTPLNAIIGLTDLALGNENLDKDSYTTFEKVNNAGMTLLSTVNDILDISKIESGKFELVPAVYEIPSMVNDTITQSIMHKGEKPIQFILDIDGNLPVQLYGDELRIKQIFNNLLSNAFKYTREGTVELSINCVREGETVWMTACVRDSGIGIRPEFLNSIFDNYAQMDVQANRRIMGTGLGLSITKMIVGLMNGTISVESEYGKGSVFTVRLPQKYVSDIVIGPGMAESLKSFRYYEQKRRQNSKLVRVRMPYARVLIVDDVVTNLDVAKGLMKPYGMQVDCVTSGQEAIDAIRRETIRYNAVFMDHMMPEMDGVEATRIIRETIGSEYAKTVPIIALTANAIAGNEEMFLSKGFQSFISKPIELTQLDAVIRQWVRDKEKEKLTADSGGSPDFKNEQDKRIVFSRRSGLDRRKVNMHLTGLDIDKGIERFNGDRETYFQVLHSFMVHTRPLLDSMKDVTEKQLASYAITVHGIKGSSRGIFADMIGNAAENLEKAAKAGDFAYVSTHNKTFLEAAWKLVFDLEDMLLNTSSGAPKPLKHKPDEELLLKLLEACKSYSMDDVDDVLAKLEKYQYDDDDGLVSWLIDNIKLMNFKQIIERLS